MNDSTAADRSLHERLRLETRSHHEHLHSVVRLDCMLESKSHYLSGLQQYFHAVATLERGVEDMLLQSKFPQIGAAGWKDRLQKTQWLEDDLRALGRFVDVHIPAVESSVNLAIARAYLLEGMTLGGQLIAKQVQQALHINETSGARFFNGYGGRTGENWNAFKKWLNDIEPHCDIDSVVASAKQTFDEFERLYSSKGAVR